MNEVVNVARDFSRYPAGRYPADGKFNGETFRKKFLLPRLSENLSVTIQLDGAISYGSSFLEEAFGGLVREEKFTRDNLGNLLKLVSEDCSLIEEIQSYIDDACELLGGQ